MAPARRINRKNHTPSVVFKSRVLTATINILFSVSRIQSFVQLSGHLNRQDSETTRAIA